MQGPYLDHILDASDVCSNCFRRIRVERIDPTRSGLTRDFESHYTRNDRTTEIAYGPASRVAEHKGVFCDECGTESAFDRIWETGDIDRERFRELTKNAIRSLEQKDVSIDRRRFAEIALARFAEDATVDEALKQATDHAIAVAATSGDRMEARP